MPNCVQGKGISEISAAGSWVSRREFYPADRMTDYTLFLIMIILFFAAIVTSYFF
ncbi:Uncharacterised protein [Enterobacter hormaechei]|nr:Uncharacterised protein [Enterobacter hormaechei]